MGMGIRGWNWPDDISSAWPIGLGLDDMTLNRTNPDKYIKISRCFPSVETYLGH